MKSFLIIALIAAAAIPAKAADIAIALTDDFIRVDTGFAGARLTLFGAVTGVENPAESVDIVSVIRGPDADFDIRRIERRHLIWMPGDVHRIENAPGLYLTNATKPITDIAPLPDQAAYHLGADFLDVTARRATETDADADHDRLFADAFLTEAEDTGLYQDRVGGVAFKKGALFTINADLPPDTPVGEYAVSVFLFRNGELLSRDSARLAVNKVGIERRIYEIAYKRPVSYGVFCVVLSLLAGWLASLAFRK